MANLVINEVITKGEDVVNGVIARGVIVDNGQGFSGNGHGSVICYRLSGCFIFPEKSI